MATNDSTPRTIEIQLNKGYSTIIDAIDACDAMFHPKWNIRVKKGRVYAGRVLKPYVKKHGKTQSLHRFVASRMLGRDLEHHEFVDHINGNTLDNRRSNLRVCTHKQNTRNSKLSKANRTGYKGVAFRKGNWIAEISPDGKKVYLGRFASAIDAAIAYNIAAKKYYSEYAKFNDIDGWENCIPQHPPRKKRTNYTSKPYYTRVRYQGKRWSLIVKRDGKEKTIMSCDTEEEARNYEQRYILENAA